MAFEIVRNDIVKVRADAIVDPANPRPMVGGGTDSAIHAAAGPELLEARRAVGPIPCGAAAITPAFGLEARYVIHAVGPSWVDGTHGEEALLRRTYESALALAAEHRCRSVAFPLLSAGSYGFPRDRALSVAVRTCSEFLLTHRMHITLVVFRQEEFSLSRQLEADVKSYIDEHYVEEATEREYEAFYGGRRLSDAAQFSRRMVQAAPCAAPEGSLETLQESLRERLSRISETFTESMLHIIADHDWLEPEVYGRILMDRKTFNKIRNNPNHHPQRKTALQLAFALRLNLDQVRDLIGKAGYALSDSSRADLILMYCIEHRVYDIDVIDGLLVENGEAALFTSK